MWCSLRTVGLLSVTLFLVFSLALASTTTTTTIIPRSTESSNNATVTINSSNMDVLDVRSPPRVQNQIKQKMSSKYSTPIEPSHAGVAIPITDEELVEESTKKNLTPLYKLDRPATTTTTENSVTKEGLSTWVLLHGYSSTTPKLTTTKILTPIISKDEKDNETLMLSDKPLKIEIPKFKQRTTSVKPAKQTTTTVKVNTFSPSTRKPIKLTKIKASLMKVNLTTTTTEAVTATTVSAATLPVEAKDGEADIPEVTAKKPTKPKKKKNKNRRRKPSKSSKEGDNKLKETPGTQLYSYLKSEILPVTVGVSLVGLLVTAGLASYYLQPFAALRRSDPIDRKDTENNYYYQDAYSNGMPEEEAIGKVIAGMPENFLQPTTNQYGQNVRYRHVDRRSQVYMNPYGLVEDVKLHDRPIQEDRKPYVVTTEAVPAVVPEHGPRRIEERKFVVGNIPKELIPTGASPRWLRVRKRRATYPDDMENEIIPSQEVITSTEEITTQEDITITTEEVPKETTPHNIYNPNERPNTFLELLADIFRIKMHVGLELVQNITNSVTKYINQVHTRLDEHYKRTHPIKN